MIEAKLRSAQSLILAAALVAGAAYVGCIAVEMTALNVLGSGTQAVSALISQQPEAVLSDAVRAYAVNKATVPTDLLPAIRRAATAMPLDERPYLLIGSDFLRLGHSRRATQVLEAGRRLDPRERWIHLLLLQRYLHDEKFTAVAEELAVMARLIDAAQAPIATALAQMSIAPETRNSVNKMLRRDTPLELSVLTALADSDVEPSTIVAMASPSALLSANAPGGWGTVLVDRLVNNHQYRIAHAVWQRINQLSNQQVEPLIYDADLQGLRGNPPFNWTLESGALAAVNLNDHTLKIDYYGRDAGDLVSQLLIVPPGRYRFSHMIRGAQRAAGSALNWSIECANDPGRNLAKMQLPLNASAPRDVAVDFTVSKDCPAQRLHLVGSPGEFAAAVSIAIARLRLNRLGDK